MNDNFKPVVIWLALVNSAVLYVAIAWIGSSPRTTLPFAEVIRQQPVPILYALAALMFAASYFIPDMLLRPSSPPADGEVRPAVTTAVLRALVVRWAITESVAIFGMVAALAAHAPLIMLPPFLLAMVGFALSFPSTRRLDQLSGKTG